MGNRLPLHPDLHREARRRANALRDQAFADAWAWLLRALRPAAPAPAPKEQPCHS